MINKASVHVTGSTEYWYMVYNLYIFYLEYSFSFSFAHFIKQALAECVSILNRSLKFFFISYYLYIC